MSSKPTNLLTPGQPDPRMDPNYRSTSIPAITTFGFTDVGPPSAVYVQRDDTLSLNLASQISQESVTFNIRQLLTPTARGGQPDSSAAVKGALDPMSSNVITTDFQMVALPAGVRGSGRAIVLNEGYLLSVVAFAGTATLRGQTFARAFVLHGGPTNSFGAYMLFGDYPTVVSPVGWPGGRVLHPTEGPGFLHPVNVGNPAGGVDFVLQAPPATRWRLISLQATLNVANSGAARPVEFIVSNGGVQTARMATNVGAPINAGVRVNFSNNGTPSTLIPTDIYAQMPAGVMLGPGDNVASSTTNIVAGDTWTGINALVEEWLEVL